jgi:hypothetical protein
MEVESKSERGEGFSGDLGAGLVVLEAGRRGEELEWNSPGVVVLRRFDDGWLSWRGGRREGARQRVGDLWLEVEMMAGRTVWLAGWRADGLAGCRSSSCLVELSRRIRRIFGFTFGIVRSVSFRLRP